MFFFSKFYAIYFAVKVASKGWNLFTMEKVVNPTVQKNNLFHQVSSITTSEVVFSHPLGLTELVDLPLHCGALPLVIVRGFKTCTGYG